MLCSINGIRSGALNAYSRFFCYITSKSKCPLNHPQNGPFRRLGALRWRRTKSRWPFPWRHPRTALAPQGGALRRAVPLTIPRPRGGPSCPDAAKRTRHQACAQAYCRRCLRDLGKLAHDKAKTWWEMRILGIRTQSGGPKPKLKTALIIIEWQVPSLQFMLL
jgi:hypothetical protein